MNESSEPAGVAVDRDVGRACGMMHDSRWRMGAHGLPYQWQSFACTRCGYSGLHDTHPGCRNTRPNAALCGHRKGDTK
jgi:hypothetical protein